ncbi:hypothetical protein [Micromonospora sp. b486]|uniref:hypothetical protein n=1 Tax=Micromonospora sp. b486 TaxID=3053986 RepID=UPI00338DA6E3
MAAGMLSCSTSGPFCSPPHHFWNAVIAGPTFCVQTCAATASTSPAAEPIRPPNSSHAWPISKSFSSSAAGQV